LAPVFIFEMRADSQSFLVLLHVIIAVVRKLCSEAGETSIKSVEKRRYTIVQ
jgi:hypothetical protein